MLGDSLYPWTDRVINEEVLQGAEVERKLICEFRARQMLKILGKCTRKKWSENLVFSGKNRRERSRGRRRTPACRIGWESRELNTRVWSDYRELWTEHCGPP